MLCKNWLFQINLAHHSWWYTFPNPSIFFFFFWYRASNVAMAPSMVESYLNQGIGPIPGVSTVYEEADSIYVVAKAINLK